MSQIRFEERAVAFIDVLGFKSLVNAATVRQQTLSELQRLVELLEGVVPGMDRGVDKSVPKKLIPRHICISDSIILSAPLAVTLKGWRQYSGLEIVVMRAIQLTHRFLLAGHLVRGGIAIGKAWHKGSNIVGPAYQEACQLEHHGGEPRIVLSDNARDLWKRRVDPASRMCIEYDGAFMVNGLHSYYIPPRAVHDNQAVFGAYEAIAQKKIGAFSGSPRYKWWWFEQYIRAEKANA